MSYLYKYIALALAFVFVGVIKSSPLEPNMAFILAALILLGIIFTAVQRRKATFNMLFSSSNPEIFFISSIVLLMIEITGGTTSQLYFLNYFLLFGLPLISTPPMSLIFALSILLYYIPDIARDFNTDIILKLGSILFIMPLSYFLSNELMKRQRENKELKEKAQQIKESAEALEADEDDIDAREKLDEIIESAQDLKDKS